jgi:hypothetical protein
MIQLAHALVLATKTRDNWVTTAKGRRSRWPPTTRRLNPWMPSRLPGLPLPGRSAWSRRVPPPRKGLA